MQRRPTKFDPKKPQILIVEAWETLRDAMERQRLRTGYGGGFTIYFNWGAVPSKSTVAPTSAFG
jgi:hypothetical protein